MLGGGALTEDEIEDEVAPWRPKLKPKPFIGLGLILPLAPTTWEDESGNPIEITKEDALTRKHVSLFPAPPTTGSPTRGWDDEWRCWREAEVVWDGAAPERSTPGHSKGLLLDFYPSSAIIRQARLVPTRDTTLPSNPVVPKSKRELRHEC
jgi:hypothetical protein